MPAFSISRSIVIARSPEQVFDKVSDFHSWTSWSPWLGIDPEAHVSVDGDGTSIGSIYRWSGDVVGAGEIEHVDLQRPLAIDDDLRFSKPFKSKSKVRFLLDRVSGGTELTWQMNGSLPWFLFWMRPSMEAFVGMDYQRGLKMLRDLIEKGEVLSQTDVIGVESLPALTVCGVREYCASEEMGPAMDRVFSAARSGLSADGFAADGKMVSVYHAVDMKRGRFDFTGGFTVKAADTSRVTNLDRCDIPATRALHLRHTGSYDHLGNAWSGGYQYARYKKLKVAKTDSYEFYRNDPDTTPASELVTDIYIPVR